MSPPLLGASKPIQITSLLCVRLKCPNLKQDSWDPCPHRVWTPVRWEDVKCCKCTVKINLVLRQMAALPTERCTRVGTLWNSNWRRGEAGKEGDSGVYSGLGSSVKGAWWARVWVCILWPVWMCPHRSPDKYKDLILFLTPSGQFRRLIGLLQEWRS